VDSRVWETPPEHVRIKIDYADFLRWPRVTAQEREVLDMLARGYGTGEMAEKLEVSAPTVCQVKGSIGEKLEAFYGPMVTPDGCVHGTS